MNGLPVSTRTGRWCAAALAAALAAGAALGAPAPAWGVGRILEIHDPLPDFDSRTGEVAPSAEQLAEVAALGASARWNRFGTVHSLIRHGGTLGSGYAADPATAARDWVRDHAGLFRLGEEAVDGLELLNVSPLSGGGASAVLFRQRFGGLPAADGGLITVGVAGGSVYYASSSSAGEQAGPGAPAISAVEAWLAAAVDVGLAVVPLDVGDVRQEHGWTVFEVAGLAQGQRARPVAFPTVGQGALAAFETIVLHAAGGEAIAYTSFVDAQSGAVLSRHNRVDRLAGGVRNVAAPVAETQVFQGVYSEDPDPPACGPFHGPYAVPSGFLRILVTATAAIITNDIFIELHFQTQGNVVGTGDLGTSPETLLYEPPGMVPAGDYFVRICPFQPPPAPPLPPYDYAGSITWDDTEAPTLFDVPKWDVFLANPPLDGSGADTRTLACWTLVDFDGAPVPGCEFELENLAARAPWDHVFQLGSSSFTTTGNAARSAEAWLSPLTPAEGYQPVAPDRSYTFEWLNTWQAADCSPLVFTPPGLTNANDVDAAAVNLFAMHNRMHDWSYFLGFTERNFNLQLDNFGTTPPDRQFDPELGNVQAGAVTGGPPSFLGRDNANQITLNDGIPGITNMYLWQPIAAAFYPPCVDGDYDMAVIGHEYTHAISNRMVGGPDANIGGAQGGAMGESWSDLVAVEYLNEYGFVPTGGEHPFAVGAYVTGNSEKGIRNYNLSRNLAPPAVLPPTAPLTTRNPLNYSNVGYDITGVQVHSDGEIWSATNGEIRELLIAKYDGSFPASDAVLQKRCADGLETAEDCPGNRRWIQIVFDAFLLMPAAPSMVDARDAYLAADQMRFGGANQLELWRGFARRGLGEDAASAGGGDGNPTPSFASPLEGEANLVFRILEKGTNAPVEAEVYIGHYEARSVPVADTVAATSLDDAAPVVTGVTYDFLVRADGYGHVRFPRAIPSGWANSTRTLTVRLAPNLASIHNGASAGGDGVNHDALIDDTETTNWASLDSGVIGDQVTVDLAGGTHTVRRVGVSAMLRPTDAGDPNDSAAQSRFTALRQFEIATCIAGTNLLNPTCSGAIPAGFTTIFTSPSSAFPGGVPRPLAPDMILREFDVPDTPATHVQLRVVHSQCTGGPAYQGEQDADPLNSTDCDTVSANGGRVRAAELQVYSITSNVP